MSRGGRLRCAWATAVLAVLMLASVPMRAQRGSGQQPGAPATQESGQSSTPQSKTGGEAGESDPNDVYYHSSVVRAIGSKLGLSPEAAATVFEVTNFVILAGLVGWFLVRTLPKTFRDRNSSLQKHLVDARAATEEANARLNSVEDRLGKLDGQIAAMKGQAARDLEAEEKRVRASIEEEKQKMLDAADQEIQVATTQARRQLQQYAADLAIEQAAKKLVVTAETDRLLVQRFAQRLAEDGGKGEQN